MWKKTLNISFCCIFMLMIFIPMICTNFQENTISETENRYLASKPVLFNNDGEMNDSFISDFETWFNDNIGLRSHMVASNALIQYYLFNSLPKNSNMYLGPNGELNYATPAMLKDYQHINLYSEERLIDYAYAMKAINRVIQNKGATFYYYQCWDKHSIYPEQFPNTVIQHGSVSKTDNIVKALNEYSDSIIISSKEKMIENKRYYDTYGCWTDPSHWTKRGALIGYRLLIEQINQNEGTSYCSPSEQDYRITLEDKGDVLFGRIHEPDYLERFDLLDKKSIISPDSLGKYAEDQRNMCLVNEFVGNDKTVLIFGDSYFSQFLLNEFAWTFHKVVFIHVDNIRDLVGVLDCFSPNIVILECAERVDSSDLIMEVAYNLP